MKIVGRQILHEQGCYSRQRVWYEGHIRGINGIWTWGFQGEPQTMKEIDVIKPLVVFEVRGSEEGPLLYF
jgi:hypothetical protein